MSDNPPSGVFPPQGEPNQLYAPPMVGLAEFIQTDVVCSGCGYNLRGQSRDGRCPECGVAVMDAFRRGQLTYCDVGWLRRVRSGLVIGFWGVLGSVIFSCLTFGAMFLAGNINFQAPQGSRGLSALGVLFWIPSLVLQMIVLYRMTTPEPRPGDPATLKRTGRARIIVTLAWVLVAVMVVQTLIGLWIVPVDPFMMFATPTFAVYQGISGLLWCVLISVIFILGLMHVRAIARRDSTRGLGRLFTVLIWGSGINAITFALATVFGMFMIHVVSSAMVANAAAMSQPTSGMVALSTTLPASMPASRPTSMPFGPAGFPAGSFRGHSGHAMLLFPLLAIGECFGAMWVILFIVAGIQFYRALSRAITHNIGMADVFVLRPPPTDSKQSG